MNRRFGTLPVSVAVLFLASSLPASRPAGPPGPKLIKILVLSGQNNHDWRTTTPKLVEILQESGRFEVTVDEAPARLCARRLDPYDVILSNWNAFGLDPKTAVWPEATRQAYLDFVRQGKGHVVVHAGSASFPEWGEYLRLTLATFKKGQTYHGPYYEFPVRFEKVRHPVTEGLEPFTTNDELWNAPELAPGAEVLASSFSETSQAGTGRWEPSVLAGRYGDGRTLTIMIGHDAAAMDNPGFKKLLPRAVEWAATGSVAPGLPAQPAGPWHWDQRAGSRLALDVIVLRYRVLVHPGRWHADRLKREAARFSGLRARSSEE